MSETTERERIVAALESLVSEHRKEAERYAELLGISEARPSANGHRENGHEKGA